MQEKLDAMAEARQELERWGNNFTSAVYEIYVDKMVAQLRPLFKGLPGGFNLSGFSCCYLGQGPIYLFLYLGCSNIPLLNASLYYFKMKMYCFFSNVGRG